MKIILTNIGTSLSEHYLQTLTLLYFPCESFGKDKNDKTLDLSLERKNGILSGKMSFADNGTFLQKSLEREISYYIAQTDCEKCFAGELFLSLFCEITGYMPPWGMMTGVRPARFALGFMLKGYSKDETEDILCKYYKVSRSKAELAADVAANELALYDKTNDSDCNLYIGIPFCPTKCRYCSFVSYATERLISMLPDYVSRLKADLSFCSSMAADLGLAFKTLYVGGGTPGMLNESELAALIGHIRQCVDISSLSEFTFELGRPDTVTEAKLKILKSCGVTRICINTQTTNDSILASVGRAHTYEDYKRAMNMARTAGFDNINTDLIAGLPGESYESFCKSVDDVLNFFPENITVHTFSLKKSAEFKLSGIGCDTDICDIERMLDYAKSALANRGYDPYYIYRQKNTPGNFENIGFARDGKICLYNIYMMDELSTVFAVGAGAATKLVSRNRARSLNLYNPKYPYEYLSYDRYIYKNREETIKFYEETK